MNTSSKAVLVISILLAGGFLVLAGMNSDSGPKDEIGLSSTKLSLASGESATLSTWILPEYSESSDIRWVSDNTAVATVDNGVVTAVSDGKANITATVIAASGTYSDSCEVTVSATPDRSVRAYDPFSDRYDYLKLEGEGFTGTWDSSGNLLSGAVLGASFNKGGFMEISLTGLPVITAEVDSYFTDKYQTGGVMTDFESVRMVLNGNGVTITADHVYGTKDTQMYTDSSGITYNRTSYSPILYIKGLPFGEYGITFTLTDFNGRVFTVSGTITYIQGDGRYDTNFEYTRHHVWRSDIRSSYSAVNPVTHTVDVSYDYADYWNSLLRTVRSSHTNSAGLYVNCTDNYECVDLAEGSDSVIRLASKLQEEFIDDYPAYSTDGQYYAQYLLGFIQIAYIYEYDQYLYFDCGNDSECDIWAPSNLTLFTGMGDCEDTSILLCDIYRQAGFDTALLMLPDHMMATVSIPTYTDYGLTGCSVHKITYEGRSYYFCETTTSVPIYLCSRADDSSMGHFSPKAAESWIALDPFNDYYVSYFLGFISSSYQGKDYQIFEI